MDIVLLAAVIVLGAIILLVLVHGMGYRIDLGVSIYRVDVIDDDDDGDIDAMRPNRPSPRVESLN